MPYDFSDTERIKDIVENTYNRYKHKRYNHERIWYRNILYLLGQQWITWDDTEHRWRKKRLANWIPTPVTNRYMSTAERLVAVLFRIEPNWVYVPASDREEDITAAQIADQIEDIICEENEINTIRGEIARWLVYTGNAFMFSWAEDITPQQQMLPDDTLLPPQPPEYKLYTEILSPFEVYADLSTSRIANQERILLISRKDKEWVRKTYGVDVEESEPEDIGLKYLEAIGYSTEDTGNHQAGNNDRIPRVTIKRILIQPCEDWPEGLFAVQCGEQVIDARPLPKTIEGKPYLPFVHIPFDSITGAFFGRTPMNDIAQKQTQRNKLESMIELITLRMSSPVWLMPEGTTVRGFSGEPGAVLKWSALGDRAEKPDRIPGEQVPSTLIKWLEQIDKDIEELAATAEVLKGQSPYSGAPGVVIDQLIEQGLSRFGPALFNISEGYRQWMKIQMELFRMYATTPRITASIGENKRWKLQQFSQADMQGAINVRIESDSTVPRSNQANTALTLALVQTGLIDLSDPMVRFKVLKKFGQPELMEAMDEQILSAVRENEMMLAGIPVQVKPFIDDPLIHIPKHVSLANSEEGAAIMDELLQHITSHYMIMDAEANPGISMPETGQPQPNGGMQKSPATSQALQPKNGLSVIQGGQTAPSAV